jgi:hypothetical protein
MNLVCLFLTSWGRFAGRNFGESLELVGETEVLEESLANSTLFTTNLV